MDSVIVTLILPFVAAILIMMSILFHSLRIYILSPHYPRMHDPHHGAAPHGYTNRWSQTDQQIAIFFIS